MYLLEVDLEMIGPLEHLPALGARMRDEAALVLVPDVSEEGALEVEAPVTRLAAELLPLGGLVQGEDVVSVGDAFEPAPAAAVGRGHRGRRRRQPLAGFSRLSVGGGDSSRVVVVVEGCCRRCCRRCRRPHHPAAACCGGRPPHQSSVCNREGDTVRVGSGGGLRLRQELRFSQGK